MKFLFSLLISVFTMANTTQPPASFHSFTMKDIRGKEVNLAAYKGKTVLVVNTASKCGYTPQYKELQALYEKYQSKDFVILGFPANEFGGQEPGSDETIAEFCEVNFGVKFPLFSKVVVKGDGIHPLFRMLTAAENPDFKGEINWNFEKFLINEDGQLVRRFRSRTTPMSAEMTTAIDKLIN
ncbi:MAG: Hydroperoxy fatty acid reductase 1 [Bacteroidota bacterium]